MKEVEIKLKKYDTRDFYYTHIPVYGYECYMLVPKGRKAEVMEGCYVWDLHHCEFKHLYVGRSENIFQRLNSEWPELWTISLDTIPEWRSSGIIAKYYQDLMYSEYKPCNSKSCDHIPRITCSIMLTDNSVEVEKLLIEICQPILNKRYYTVDLEKL